MEKKTARWPKTRSAQERRRDREREEGREKDRQTARETSNNLQQVTAIGRSEQQQLQSHIRCYSDTSADLHVNVNTFGQEGDCRAQLWVQVATVPGRLQHPERRQRKCVGTIGNIDIESNNSKIRGRSFFPIFFI